MPTLDRPLTKWTRNFALAMSACCELSIAAGSARAQEAPKYKVDPFWPKPLPHHWLMQGVPVMVVDKDDHIWVMNRPRDVNPDEIGAASTPPRTDCCVAAPAVLEFDTEGNLLQGWGGPGYVPRSGRRTRHSRGSGRKCLDLRQRPRRHHHEIYGRRKAPLGVRPSRTASQAGRGCAAIEAKQSGHGRIPHRHIFLRLGRRSQRDLHRRR